MRSYAATEEDDMGMALKILTQAEDMPYGKDKLESYTYSKWKRAPTYRNKAEDGLTN